MNLDDNSDLREPFGLFKQLLRETEAEREKYNYGKKKPSRPEGKLEALVGQSLEKQGISVTYQVKCDAGIADIVTPNAIYEIKPDIRYPGKLFEAIGQVLVYRQIINPSANAFVIGYAHRGGHSQPQLASIQSSDQRFGVTIIFWQREEGD